MFELSSLLSKVNGMCIYLKLAYLKLVICCLKKNNPILKTRFDDWLVRFKLDIKVLTLINIKINRHSRMGRAAPSNYGSGGTISY